MFKINFNNLYIKTLNKNFSKLFEVLFFALFLFIGLSIVKDYGLSTDEPFQRTNGYLWYLKLIETFSSNQEYIEVLKNKFETMYWSQEMNNGFYNEYGVLFDLFAASVEEFLEIKNNLNVFYTKHILTFLLFFLSSIFFYKIIYERFQDRGFSILITLFYISSPRIFAESFYNCKDIVFMCFCVFALYFCLKSINKFSFKNNFYFSLFAALATDIRIMGILFFVLYLIFFLFNSLENKNFFKTNYKKIILFFFSYFLFVFIFWPFLWDAPLQNFLLAFKSFSNYGLNLNVFFLGEYIQANNLPWYYIPVWILITSPIIFSIFFFIGLIKISLLLFNNFLNVSEKNKLWKQKYEQKDIFVAIFFLLPIFSVIFLNSTLYGGWRHLYFIYPSFVYLIAVGINYILGLNFKNYFKKILFIIIFLSLSFNFYGLFKLHPYQNVYFNFLVEKRANKLFEIDYWGLGNKEAINFMVNSKTKNNNVSVRTASFTPLFYSKLVTNTDDAHFRFTGTQQIDQDFIFTNYIYESDPKYLKKYLIPKNYSKFFSLKRGNIIINEIYKKE
jgi:hypothetical protein